MLDRIRVVLVNTSHPGNIGGAARAMKNMGLSQLVLVQPESFPHGDAVARASGATDILDAARVVDTLEEALSGCSVVLGTSARDRRIPWPLLDPRECATTCLEHLEANGEVALVFGREYAGLTNEELQRCQFHVHIPSDPEFGSLNLAAAVQVLTYEVRMAWLAAQGKPTKMEKFESTSMLNTELVTADEPGTLLRASGEDADRYRLPRSGEAAPPDVAVAAPVWAQRDQQAGNEYPARDPDRNPEGGPRPVLQAE